MELSKPLPHRGLHSGSVWQRITTVVDSIVAGLAIAQGVMIVADIGNSEFQKVLLIVAGVAVIVSIGSRAMWRRHSDHLIDSPEDADRCGQPE